MTALWPAASGSEGGGTGSKNLLFLKKKKQKDFDESYPRQIGKVFWFFFPKKNRLLALLIYNVVIGPRRASRPVTPVSTSPIPYSANSAPRSG